MVALLAIAVVSPAFCGAETAVSETSITPRGTLFREVPRSVDAHLKVTVIPDPGSARLRELNNTRLNLPTDLKFSTAGTPVCEADIGQMNPERANRPTASVIADCPSSVVGEGTAVINIAGSVGFRITDSVLTIFNGGKDSDGNPILLTHGYSATVLPGGFGVIMVGSLDHGVLDVKVPTLPVSSAVSEFTFDLPGKTGKDPDYSQAKCSTGEWLANAVLTLGHFDSNSGKYVDRSDVATDTNHQSCVGEAGKAVLGSPKVKGPKRAREGHRRTYTVTVTNRGTATAKKVKVKARGRGATGKALAAKLAPENSKRIRVKVKFTRRGVSKVKFKTGGAKVKSKKSVYRVKVN